MTKPIRRPGRLGKNRTPSEPTGAPRTAMTRARITHTPETNQGSQRPRVSPGLQRFAQTHSRNTPKLKPRRVVEGKYKGN